MANCPRGRANRRTFRTMSMRSIAQRATVGGMALLAGAPAFEVTRETILELQHGPCQTICTDLPLVPLLAPDPERHEHRDPTNSMTVRAKTFGTASMSASDYWPLPS